MKKDFNLTKLFYSFAIAFSVVTLSSCNNKFQRTTGKADWRIYTGWKGGSRFRAGEK